MIVRSAKNFGDTITVVIPQFLSDYSEDKKLADGFVKKARQYGFELTHRGHPTGSDEDMDILITGNATGPNVDVSGFEKLVKDYGAGADGEGIRNIKAKALPLTMFPGEELPKTPTSSDYDNVDNAVRLLKSEIPRIAKSAGFDVENIKVDKQYRLFNFDLVKGDTYIAVSIQDFKPWKAGAQPMARSMEVGTGRDGKYFENVLLKDVPEKLTQGLMKIKSGGPRYESTRPADLLINRRLSGKGNKK